MFKLGINILRLFLTLQHYFSENYIMFPPQSLVSAWNNCQDVYLLYNYTSILLHNTFFHSSNVKYELYLKARKNQFSWVSIKPVIQWYSDVSQCTLWLPYSHTIVPYFKEYNDIVSKNDHFPCYSLKLIFYCKGRIVQEINFCLYVAVKCRVNKIWISDPNIPDHIMHYLTAVILKKHKNKLLLSCQEQTDGMMRCLHI